jgi:ABC-type lipoprotein export system ATPase subunit
MVTVENCTKTLGPGTTFRCEAFHTEEGAQLALWGPSGCGKSTLLNLATGLLRPDSGVIRVAGEEIQELDEYDLDRFRGEHFGFVFQTFNLLAPFTALQNVMLGMRFSGTRAKSEWRGAAEELLERVGLAHRMTSLPSTMSVGERQRVAIARALANQQRIIVADEPTGSLDPKTSTEIMDLLLELCAERNTTLLLVTHERDIADRLPERFDCTGLVLDSEATVR